MARAPKHTVASTGLLPLIDRWARHAQAPERLGIVSFLVLVLVALRYHVVGDYGVETDFFWSYVPSAKDVLAGTIAIEDFRGPLYPAVLAVFGTLTGDFFTGGIILSALSAAVAITATFVLLRAFVRPDAALMGALIFGITPYVVQYSYTAGTDMFFTALVLSGAALLFRGPEPKTGDIVGASFLFALAYLTRYNGIFVLLAVPAAFIVADPYGQTLRGRLRAAAIGAGTFLVFIAPWGLYCLVEKGSFFYSRNYLNIAYEMFAKGTVPWDQYWATAAQTYGSLAEVVLADPERFLGTVVRNAFDHAASDLGSLLGWQLGVPAAAGLALMVRRNAGRRPAAFGLFALANFGLLLLVFYGERFSMTLIPAYVLPVVWLASAPELTRTKLWNWVPYGGVLLVVLLVWTGARSYAYNAEMIASGPTEIVEIARWAERNLPPEERGKVIVARKPHAGYYLGMRWVYFPNVQTQDELLAALRANDASYLLFGLMEAGMRPQFQYLLNPSRAPRELVPVVSTVSPPAVLYKVEPLSP